MSLGHYLININTMSLMVMSKFTEEVPPLWASLSPRVLFNIGLPMSPTAPSVL